MYICIYQEINSTSACSLFTLVLIIKSPFERVEGSCGWHIRMVFTLLINKQNKLTKLVFHSNAEEFKDVISRSLENQPASHIKYFLNVLMGVIIR